MAAKQLLVILGVMLAFLACTGATYYWAWFNVWSADRHGPAIGAEPLKIKLVAVTKDIPAGTEIGPTNVDEHYETVDHIALDAFSFASDCIGRKTKWALKKGQYVAKHDILPDPK
jgi:flagella basal body P-ring formation protein FlgA